jgi:glycosyltransferase involved in cell wall biosynthesis
MSSVKIPPKVSWLLCSNVLNDYLFDAINSCLNQTYKDFELIVVVNGVLAEEIAIEIKKRFFDDERLVVLISKLNYLTHSLNLGLDHARGVLVARMDADDISTNDRLMVQVDYMDKNPDVSVLGSAYTVIDNLGNPLKDINVPDNNLIIRKGLFFKNVICHPSVIFRRKIIQEVGGYMGGLRAEDYDLWCRLSLNSEVKFAALQKSYVYYRSESSSNVRKSPIVYAGVAATQLRCFLITLNPKWLFSTLISSLKCLLVAFLK